MKNSVLIFCLTLLLGCETSSTDIDPVDLQQGENEERLDPTPAEIEKKFTCEALRSERDIAAEWKDEKGQILRGTGCAEWVIIGNEISNTTGRYLRPCNLPEEFQEHEKKIVFSGYSFQFTEEERESLLDFCASHFELTEISSR